MDTQLQLTLLGAPQICVNQQPLTERVSKKARALLFYLAMTGRAQARDSLMALFWPEMNDSQARNNLRAVLPELNKSLGDHLSITTETVKLERTSHCWVDVHAFETALAGLSAPTKPSLAAPAALQQALQLYQGEFLQGFHIRNAAPFEDWLLGERERLRLRLIDGLTAFSEQCIASGDYANGINAARRLLVVEPWLEQGHLQLMRLLAHNGQRTEALQQYERCKKIMRDEFDAEPGEVINAFYQQIRTGDVAARPIAVSPTPQAVPSHPPPATRHPTPNNLIPALNVFVGRNQELADLCQSMVDDSVRLVTLVGPGGGGKTRLALEVATTLLPSFADGVWFIDLAALTDPTLLPSTVVAVLGLHPQTGRPLLSLLLDWLRNKQLLLLLDNCEHLLDACATFANAVLHHCPHVHLLATSREALGMAGEQCYPVEPLTLPPPSADARPDDLLTYDAVRLFVVRATLAQPTFQLTVANAPAVAQLCRQLDGIPLALELAAASVKAMPIQVLLERLTDRFQLLVRGNRTALPRHQTLRASVDWSYALLTEPERILLQRLAIFAGGWTLAAAEAVCSDDPFFQPLPGTGPPDPLASPKRLATESLIDLLARLVEKSLVILDEQPEHTRYRLLESIRQYAHEKLQAANEQDRLGYRHHVYFLQVAGEGEAGMEWGQRVQTISRLRADLDNLRAAILWACSHDADAACLLVGRLRWFWYYVNYMSECEQWYRRVLALPSADVITPGRALATLGQAALQFFNQRLNPALLAQAVENFQTLNDPVHLCEAVQWYGFTLFLVGKAAEAQHPFSQYAALLRQSATPLVLGYALGFNSLVEPDMGRAKQLLDEGLALGRRWQEPAILAHIYFYLGIWAQRQQEYGLAKTYYLEGLTYERMGSNQWLVTLVLCHVGDVTGLGGNWDEAGIYFAEALQRSYTFGFEKYRANFLARLGYVTGQQGEPATAERYITEGLGIYQTYGDQGGMTLCLICYAELRRLQGDSPLAVQLLAVNAVRTTPFPFDQLLAGRVLTAARQQLGEAEFGAAWESGQALTLAEALALARPPR